ncbi:MAG TPA: SGNH/GDSL hydrolase family protein [Candidatus Ratteibacteria bacterium]|nr:SGNH/GDSL hydrolase family protein [bacterium]HRS05458.1 SGNH/GDSL hydrolase family protein [Candidatus Ratteibacteria bacterium]
MKNFLQVVVFGDSLTWSPGVAMGERYADFLEKNLQDMCTDQWYCDVAACGDGGNTAEEGLSRIQRDCLSYNPHIVVLNFGANDSVRAPSKQQFMECYRKIINTIKHSATNHIILETTPTLDQQWHSQKNNPSAIFYGGLENYLEFFSHSFIRETAKLEDLILYDRFSLYHQKISEQPCLREKWIQKDGVHLTGEGNRFFAEGLASIIKTIIPEVHLVQTNPETWLEDALLNPVYIECCESLQTGRLKEYFSEPQGLKRLMLQKTRSFSRRAMAFADNEELQNKAYTAYCLASGFMAAERIYTSQDKEISEKSVRWAMSYLKNIPENNLIQKLIEIFEKL